MGWDPALLNGNEYLILSTHGGVRKDDGTAVALGYHTGHWEVGMLVEAAARQVESSLVLFRLPARARIRATGALKGRRLCSTVFPIATMRRRFSNG